MSGAPATLRGVAGAPVLGIVGWKKSGKTTLIVKLVVELTRRGRRVATIKHAHHDIDVDAGETDSARHRRAGAGQVAIVSRHRWAIVRELGQQSEPALAEIVARLDPCDLILVEGYKSAAIPKIEVRRQGLAAQANLADSDGNIIAIVADAVIADVRVPVFGPEQIGEIADFIEQLLGLPSSPATDGQPP